MTPKEILIEARRLLVEEGWCTGSYHRWDASGRLIGHCAIGAICFAHPEKMIEIGAYTMLENLLDHNVSAWNDAQTSVEPVLAKFDEAIASLP